MYININDIKISYDRLGEGEPVILLHGWGCNKNTWNNVCNKISEKYLVYKIDLPGFGLSEEPVIGLSIDDITDIIYKFNMLNNIENPIIIGHSYGGRVGIRYASLYKVKKLILVSSPGVKIKKSFKKIIKEKTYKLLKRLHIKNNMGSKDYKEASAVKKQMIVKAVNFDLLPYLKNIKAPTLIIWGDKDKTVTYKEIKLLNKNIKDSGLVIMDDCGHFPYIENLIFFLVIIDSFLESDLND